MSSVSGNPVRVSFVRHGVDYARLVDGTWLTSPFGGLLHAPGRLTPAVLGSLAASDGAVSRIQAACGRWIRPEIPGMFSRLSAPRCARCCDRTGVPRGEGSPKNIVKEEG